MLGYHPVTVETLAVKPGMIWQRQTGGDHSRKVSWLWWRVGAYMPRILCPR